MPKKIEYEWDKNCFKEILKGIWKAFESKEIACDYATNCKWFGNDRCFFCKHNVAIKG